MTPASSAPPPKKAANTALVSTIKAIMAAAREGHLDTAYQGYRDLFEGPAFAGYDPHERRQALRLMVYAKGIPTHLTNAMVEAHRAAIAPLRFLVQQHGDPSDYEMLGICCVAVNDSAAAEQAFRAGLSIERERNLQSDLCGALMRRIAAL